MPAAGLPGSTNLRIFGITDERVIAFPEFELELWGNAHHDYNDNVPLRDPVPRVEPLADRGRPRPLRAARNLAQPIAPVLADQRRDIAATGADYVALGHWDRPMQVGDGSVPAYYSGSPDWAKTVNLIRLTANGDVVVTREALP